MWPRRRRPVSDPLTPAGDTRADRSPQAWSDLERDLRERLPLVGISWSRRPAHAGLTDPRWKLEPEQQGFTMRFWATEHRMPLTFWSGDPAGRRAILLQAGAIAAALDWLDLQVREINDFT